MMLGLHFENYFEMSGMLFNMCQKIAVWTLDLNEPYKSVQAHFWKPFEERKHLITWKGLHSCHKLDQREPGKKNVDQLHA